MNAGQIAGQIDRDKVGIAITICIVALLPVIIIDSDILHKTPLAIPLTGFFLFGTISGTKNKYGMSTTLNQFPPYKAAELKDRNGDLSKEWYVEFYAFCGHTDGIQRKRVKVPQVYATELQKRDWANKQIKTINGLLEKGYHFPGPAPARTEQVEPPAPLTVDQVFDIAIIKAQSLRKKSIATYKGNLNKFREWLGTDASKGLDIITTSRVSEYTDYLLSNDLTGVTINNQLNQTRIMINKAKKAGYIQNNPFVFEKLQETDSTANSAFTPEHQNLLENYLRANNWPLYVFTRIMYYNFLRPKEIRFTRLNALDFRANSITVPGPVAKNRKTNTIPLHPLLSELLTEHRHYPPLFYLAGKNLKPGPYQLGENAAYEAHKDALRALNLLDGYEYTLYSWRHTGAVNAYLAGTDIKTLQYLFRHSSVVYTEIYLKSLKLQLKDIAFKNW